MKKTVVLGILLAVVGLAACGGDDGGLANSASTLTSSQLAMGTLMLEGMEEAMTVEQAGELLPIWRMLQALQDSGTAAPAELEAVASQIQGAMTSEQLAAIQEMELTDESMIGLVQELGLGRGLAGGAGGAGGFQPPAGIEPGGGGFGGAGMLGAGENLSPEEQEAATAERMNAFAGTALTGMVVSMLEARAEGETWEVAETNPEVELQRALTGAVAEATGLDEQAVTAQARQGQSLLAIAEANGADVDEIVAQVVALETERVGQAVADGALEQAEGDQALADLEARVRDMLEGAFQFGGGQGAPGGGAGQP